MASLKNIYHVRENLRGKAKLGYCRPTIAEMWDPDDDYDYTWCTLEPIYTTSMEAITTVGGDPIMVAAGV